jgi:hypothetical protein
MSGQLVTELIRLKGKQALPFPLGTVSSFSKLV